MGTTSEPRSCPKCGGPISAEAPQGLCPKCLLLLASSPTEAGKGSAGHTSPPTHEELAAAFPQLEILELIGQGGMGYVFKARQPKIERLVALKILPQSLAADPAFAERFTREGRVLARLNHANIVTLYDFGQANGLFYLLMEFVDGVNLRQAMKVGRFTAAQALSIVPKICEALQFAHNEGILHRDIKPENILLDTKGRVKIADFGIAKLVTGGEEPPGPAKAAGAVNLTETGKVLGTPHYMAPEQIEHPQDVDQRADIYSLGVVFYEMLTGELPLGRFGPPSDKSSVDPRVDEVVLRTLERERDRRTKTADEVRTQVESITRSGQVAPAPNRVAAPTAATQPKPDRFWPWFAVGVLALISIPIVIALLGMLAAIVIPNFVKARQRALAQHQAAAALPAPTNSPPATNETWSPEVPPGSQPDLRKILDEAHQMTGAGQYEEALQRYLWFHNHEQESGDSYQDVVRITSALSGWEELGRRYPKAKQALLQIRDHKTSEIAEGRGYADLFRDVQAINHELQEDDATYALFKLVRDNDPKLAGQLYYYLESQLLSKGEYQWCSSQLGDPQDRFDSIRRQLEMDRESQLRMAESRQRTAQVIAAVNQQRGMTNSWTPPDNSSMVKKSSEDRFVGQTRALIEILVGTGHNNTAESIRAQAIALLDDPRLKSAVSDAGQKVQERSLRTNNP